MKQRHLAGHEQVYHAAMGCQAASLPLTAHRLRGEKKACPGQGKKKHENALFCPRVSRSKPASQTSGRVFGVGVLSRSKGLRKRR
jgi:hypothetical protein